MELSEIVSVYRKQLGMSIEDLAEKSGIPISTIKKISAGITKDPQLETVRAIAYALGCTLDDFDSSPIAQKLTPDEYAHIRSYRVLDDHGKEVVDATLAVESKRMRQLKEEAKRKSNIVPFPLPEGHPNIIDWPRADREASAGRGVYLDDESFHTIRVDADRLPRNAAFGIIIKGNSMEPTFHDHDTVMVSTRPAEKGEIGIFVQDNEGYLKKHGGAELISLNKNYAPIPLNESIRNMGTVIGVLNPEWIIDE